MMGHSENMFTETYAHLLLEATREAAERAGRSLAEHSKASEPRPAPVVPIRRGGPRRTT
jgi:hypothetical protein